MNLYDPRSKCAKCGYDSSLERYVPESNTIWRKCRRCEYEWHEAPLDQGKQDQAECGASFFSQPASTHFVCNLNKGHLGDHAAQTLVKFPRHA